MPLGVPANRAFRVTDKLLVVLHVMLQAEGEMHGTAMMRQAQLSRVPHGPAVYGALARLHSAGWVAFRWEDLPDDITRPRRKLYTLTFTGRELAPKLLADRGYPHP